MLEGCIVINFPETLEEERERASHRTRRVSEKFVFCRQVFTDTVVHVDVHHC